MGIWCGLRIQVNGPANPNHPWIYRILSPPLVWVVWKMGYTHMLYHHYHHFFNSNRKLRTSPIFSDTQITLLAIVNIPLYLQRNIPARKVVDCIPLNICVLSPSFGLALRSCLKKNFWLRPWNCNWWSWTYGPQSRGTTRGFCWCAKRIVAWMGT